MTDDCTWCDLDMHICHSCGTPLSHNDCNGLRGGACDDCHELLDRQGI